MRRISSKLTWWNKKAFPALWFGNLALVTATMIPAVRNGSVPEDLLLVPFVMAGFGALLMWWLVFPLVDEVWIDGDGLIVRNRGEEDRFPIAHIIDVDGSFMTSPESIGLWLKPKCRFGRTIRFEAPFRFFMFGTHPQAQELIDRSRCFERRDADAVE
ncbi:MAG TPA: hypothetical protein VFG04_06885 [Planctomycetaceae bacterium]|jgi:hypothetical protein|nr:hypothetical protein [Planctomycetaceae bacterium]